MSKYVLVAETGSDITAALADKLGIYLAPMHVSLGEVTKDDGAFPVEEIVEFYQNNAKLPKTSGCTPDDFIVLFDRIHAEHPEAHIVHLAYSAVTTCSYQSAILAAENRDYVVSVDTKHVSVGQAAVVLEVARVLNENPEMTIEEAAKAAREISDRMQMCFIPKNLDYLRAGGRVSNVVALTGNLLGLHPCIEILDGYLMAKKKYRGSLNKVVPKLIEDFVEKHSLEKDHVRMIWSPGLPDDIKRLAEETAAELGIRKITWMKTGCVITCHGGPSAFGIVGFAG